MMHGSQLTFSCVSRSDKRAQLKISWHDRRKINQNKSKQILNLKSEFYCFFSLKPDSTVFPPNCRSNFTKSLWESRSTFALITIIVCLLISVAAQ
jgi:hypothetical protein